MTRLVDVDCGFELRVVAAGVEDSMTSNSVQTSRRRL
jgi:hypothetical protein